MIVRIVRRVTFGSLVLLVVAAAALAGIGWHQGYRLYVVHTGSMVPALRPGDAVLDRPAPRAVHPGEVVTFSIHSGPDSVVTHRVVSVDGSVVKTKGDANRTVDPWTLSMAQIVGTAVVLMPRVGYVIVYLKQPLGLASLVTVAVGLTLLWQLFFPPPSSRGEAPAPASGPRRRHRRAGKAGASSVAAG